MAVTALIAVFTLHFATINTKEELNAMLDEYAFTLHFATINTYSGQPKYASSLHLHYTLLLLILSAEELLSAMLLHLH